MPFHYKHNQIWKSKYCRFLCRLSAAKKTATFIFHPWFTGYLSHLECQKTKNSVNKFRLAQRRCCCCSASSQCNLSRCSSLLPPLVISSPSIHSPTLTSSPLHPTRTQIILESKLGNLLSELTHHQQPEERIYSIQSRPIKIRFENWIPAVWWGREGVPIVVAYYYCCHTHFNVARKIYFF